MSPNETFIENNNHENLQAYEALVCVGLFVPAAWPTLTDTVLFTYKTPAHISRLWLDTVSTKKLSGIPGG